MMTLQQIAQFCADKIGIADNTTVAKARAFTQQRWRLVWNRYSWHQARMQQTVTVPAGTQDVTLEGNMDFPIAARWNGTEEILVTSDITMLRNFPVGMDTSGSVRGFDLIPKDAAGNARIRLYQIPNITAPLLVIGKAKCPELTADTDQPSIPGCEETLIACVLGDLMQWLRQYGKAQIHFAEATTHLDNMMQIERDVAANDMRVIPVVEPSSYSAGNWIEK
jgi:hypothetical protein